MRIITKRTRVIEMTKEEHQKFIRAMQQAAEGQTVNYAEERLEDGSYLGVSVIKDYCEFEPVPDNSTKLGKAFRP